MSDAPRADEFRPTASWSNLKRRATLLCRLRDFFETRGFLEVETPIVSAETVIDRHLDPLETRISGIGRRLFLQTSPELAMKRLLAAGGVNEPKMPAIYQVTRAFRDGEIGPLHNPEFTIVEWYRVGDDMSAGMSFLGDLCEALLERGPLEHSPVEQISYREAFLKFVDLDPHTADSDKIVKAALSAGITIPEGLSTSDRDVWLDLLLSECVGPQLGKGSPTILYDYPASQAALACIREENPPVAERFELFVDGIELANGYHELLDAQELQERFELSNRQRIDDGKQPLPRPSRLLAAIEHSLPKCTGVALGFDRLVMVAVGAKTLAEVLAFPMDRA